MAKVLRRGSADPPIPPERPPDAERPVPLPFARPGPAQEAGGRPSRPLTVAVLLGMVLVGFALAYERLTADHLVPGTRIGGVAVGSRSLDEAAALVEDQVVSPLRTEQITLRAHDTLRATAWEMGVRIAVGDALGAAHDDQQTRSLPVRLWQRVFGDERNRSLPAVISEERLRAFVSDTARRIDRPVRDATVEIHGDTLEVVPHEVGRRLDTGLAAERIVRGLRAGDTDIRLPVELTQPDLRTEHFERVILVRTGSNKLDLYVDGKVGRAYPVATGTPGYPTPHGQFKITAKRRNPTWGNPWAPWSMNMPAFIGPGPNNPLGTRALNISASGIRIHGTPDAASIGGPASHGCIRMYMGDAEELFDLVDVGTPVVIVGT